MKKIHSQAKIWSIVDLPTYNIDEVCRYYKQLNVLITSVGDQVITTALNDLLGRLRAIQDTDTYWHSAIIQKMRGMLLIGEDAHTQLPRVVRYMTPTCGEDPTQSPTANGTLYILRHLGVNEGYIVYSRLLITNLNTEFPSCEPV